MGCFFLSLLVCLLLVASSLLNSHTHSAAAPAFLTPSFSLVDVEPLCIHSGSVYVLFVRKTGLFKRFSRNSRVPKDDAISAHAVSPPTDSTVQPIPTDPPSCCCEAYSYHTSTRTSSYE